MFTPFHAALAIVLTLVGTPAFAQPITPTIYADGASCPNGCDSHVVLHPSRNGTRFASDPSSSRMRPRPCRNGQACRICFSESDASCLVATYRGSGPPADKFDFTPAFYEEFCPKPGLPQPLRVQCVSFNRTLASLTRGRIYCLANPGDPRCRTVIARAEAAKAADRPLWNECRRLGERAFNRRYAASPARQRSDGCAYERRGTGGPNSRGVTWRRLLPAVCQAGAYVGRDGTDCCDRNMMAVGGLGTECKPFLVRR